MSRKKAGLRAKHAPKSLCYPVLCGHCLPSCQAERQAPGLLVLASDSLDSRYSIHSHKPIRINSSIVFFFLVQRMLDLGDEEIHDGLPRVDMHVELL